MAAVVNASSNDYLFATWHDMLLAVWRNHTTLSAVRLGQRLFDEHAQRIGGSVLLLTIVEESAALPGSAERTELARMLENGAGRTRRSAVVYEGSGFRAAAVRSVVTGLSLFSKPPFPHKIFATVSEAVEFLAENPKKGSGLTAKQLLEVVDQTRASSA